MGTAKGNSRSVMIIGAGIAGLSAGIYAQLNGYRSRIYEMHSLPGGLMTAWKRKGYTMDGCIHWLTGSSPKSNYSLSASNSSICSRRAGRSFCRAFQMMSLAIEA